MWLGYVLGAGAAQEQIGSNTAFQQLESWMPYMLCLRRPERLLKPTLPTLLLRLRACCRVQVKIIDFGAACDMCTGINFNPLYGMLDPRYSPPEELCMPQSELLCCQWHNMSSFQRSICSRNLA